MLRATQESDAFPGGASRAFSILGWIFVSLVLLVEIAALGASADRILSNEEVSKFAKRYIISSAAYMPISVALCWFVGMGVVGAPPEPYSDTLSIIYTWVICSGAFFLIVGMGVSTLFRLLFRYMWGPAEDKPDSV